LPLFGGSSAVWVTSLLFFQLALLVGYVLADRLVHQRSLKPWLVLLVASALSVPFTLPLAAATGLPRWLAAAPPALQLLILLAAALGLPFVTLASTGPLVQALWSRERSGSPYRLYALSNLASLLGLAAYPFWFEPLFTLHAQIRIFAGAFALFASCAGALCWRSVSSLNIRKSLETGIVSNRSKTPPLWLLLPAVSSALMLAITGHLTRNVAPIPLLWMAPLAAYLLSFILCFDSPEQVSRRWTVPAALGSIALLAYADVRETPDGSLTLWIAALTAAFFFVATALHGELVRLRPEAARLTRFYLSLSLGSALGSLVVAVLIPMLCKDVVELRLSLIGASMLLSVAWWPSLKMSPRFSLSARAGLIVGIATMSLALFVTAWSRSLGDVFEGRNFYGALRVQNQTSAQGPLRALLNGTTTHGVQFREESSSRRPLAYYAETSGVGRAIATLREGGVPLRIGAVGLGAGVLAGYCQPGDRFEFYELNPLVAQVARDPFTFLRDCAGASIQLGDARLVLANQDPQELDLLVIDAFNSDAIPVHLLTAEAFLLYAHHLAKGGILAVHTSNRYLDLDPAVAAHAPRIGMIARAVTGPAQGEVIYSNEWMLLSREASKLPAADSHPIRQAIEWTDDHTSLTGAFR
jgi:hypothetical protein